MTDSCEYKQILEALEGINKHLEKLNSKTAIHGADIEELDKWVAVHDAVEKALKGIEKTQKELRYERRKNNIAILGVVIVIIIQILSMI